MTGQRELSLEEYLGQLPKGHRARRELASLLEAKDDLIRSFESERDEARKGLEEIAVAHGWSRKRAWETGTLAAEIREARNAGHAPDTESPNDPPVTRQELAHLAQQCHQIADLVLDDEAEAELGRIKARLRKGQDARGGEGSDE